MGSFADDKQSAVRLGIVHRHQITVVIHPRSIPEHHGSKISFFSSVKFDGAPCKALWIFLLMLKKSGLP
jgi:hypothetical protein